MRSTTRSTDGRPSKPGWRSARYLGDASDSGGPRLTRPRRWPRRWPRGCRGLHRRRPQFRASLCCDKRRFTHMVVLGDSKRRTTRGPEPDEDTPLERASQSSSSPSPPLSDFGSSSKLKMGLKFSPTLGESLIIFVNSNSALKPVTVTSVPGVIVYRSPGIGICNVIPESVSTGNSQTDVSLTEFTSDGPIHRKNHRNSDDENGMERKKRDQTIARVMDECG